MRKKKVVENENQGLDKNLLGQKKTFFNQLLKEFDLVKLPKKRQKKQIQSLSAEL